MTTPERREKSRQSRVANRHFRALRARQTRSSPFSALLATGRTIPAGTLPKNAVQSIERLGIGELKWKFWIKSKRHAHWREGTGRRLYRLQIESRDTRDADPTQRRFRLGHVAHR